MLKGDRHGRAGHSGKVFTGRFIWKCSFKVVPNWRRSCLAAGRAGLQAANEAWLLAGWGLLTLLCQ